MERKLQYKIEKKDHGKSIAIFLKEKEYSRGVLIELKKSEQGIRKNGKWAKVNECLKEGDILEICLVETDTSQNIIPMKQILDILYEDEDLLVINKRYDTPIHPSVNNYDNTLANGVMYYYQKLKTPYVFRCMNRLDRDTSGVTIIAKNLLSASILSNRIKQRELGRIYLAFVEGIVEEEGTIDLPIGRVEESVIKRQVDWENGKEAITHYRRLEVVEMEGQPVSIVILKLETGRTHQIRVHMSAIGHPLLGDFLYNQENQMLTRQALHGVQCRFNHPITGKDLKIVAELREDMKSLLVNAIKSEEKLNQFMKYLKDLEW